MVSMNGRGVDWVFMALEASRMGGRRGMMWMEGAEGGVEGKLAWEASKWGEI